MKARSMTTSQTARIRELNDLLRTTWLTGKVYMTDGIRALSLPLQSRVAEQVQSFDAFSPENDPHGATPGGAGGGSGGEFPVRS